MTNENPAQSGMPFFRNRLNWNGTAGQAIFMHAIKRESPVRPTPESVVS
jgi:hypothetical protein